MFQYSYCWTLYTCFGLLFQNMNVQLGRTSCWYKTCLRHSVQLFTDYHNIRLCDHCVEKCLLCFIRHLNWSDSFFKVSPEADDFRFSQSEYVLMSQYCDICCFQQFDGLCWHVQYNMQLTINIYCLSFETYSSQFCELFFVLINNSRYVFWEP